LESLPVAGDAGASADAKTTAQDSNAETSEAAATSEAAPAPEIGNSPESAETSLPGTKVPAGRSGPKSATDAKSWVLTVPYGADALGSPRLEVVRQLLERLVRESQRGIVDVKTFTGRFCLVGNATDGFSLAPDETPFGKCDLIGNPSDDALSAAQRIPLPFANLIGATRNSSHETLDVQPSTGDATALAVPYPPVSADLTAGEWNRAAGANNRVEIRIR
jgi:hypothetical protein